MIEGGRPGGRVFLVDFGGVQAAAAGAGLGLGSTVVGTYGFMAPEQFRGAAQPASDLYGLGGTLLYLLTGRLPSDFPQVRARSACLAVSLQQTPLGLRSCRWRHGRLEGCGLDELERGAVGCPVLHCMQWL